jgi:hypothetical protein
MILPSPTTNTPHKQVQSDPDAMLTLQLSSTSFLDSAILDSFCERTLYIVETRGRDTSILRASPDGLQLQTAGQVHWPRRGPLHGITDPSRIRVSMDGEH